MSRDTLSCFRFSVLHVSRIVQIPDLGQPFHLSVSCMKFDTERNINQAFGAKTYGI